MANSEETQFQQGGRPHAILFPLPLQGHVIPFVHLAIKLASRGFTITFVNTQSIHHQTSKAAGAASFDPFAAVRESSGLDIRYTTVCDGLPVEYDRSLNHDPFMESLLHVFQAHVEELLVKLVKHVDDPPVTCLIADTFFHWTSVVAHKFGLSSASFWTEPALVFSLYFHIHLLKNNRHYDCPDKREDLIDYIPGVKSIHPKHLPSYLQATDTSTVTHRIISKTFNDVRHVDYVLCNTVQELEPHTITGLPAQPPFYSIGPIFPLGFTKSAVATSLWSESNCTQWLDSKPHGSVLYISFGSYAHLSKRDLLEIANGILLSNVNFVWAIRPDIVSSEDEHPLPVGFEEAVSDRAMIIPWCSQIEVLTHPAIGGFLTHCGWNSILESVWSEVPLLCFPLLTDQFTNRKLVVDDWKVGINLGDPCGPITKEDVSENVSRLMDAKSREEIKTAVREIKRKLGDAVATDGSSEKNLESFINDQKVRISGSDDPSHASNNFNNGY